MNSDNSSDRLSIQRMLLAIALFAGSVGCYVWVKKLVDMESGYDQLVVCLVFAIPALFTGGCLCLIQSTRMGILAAVLTFGAIAILALAANAIVPALK